MAFYFTSEGLTYFWQGKDRVGYPCPDRSPPKPTPTPPSGPPPPQSPTPRTTLLHDTCASCPSTRGINQICHVCKAATFCSSGCDRLHHSRACTLVKHAREHLAARAPNRVRSQDRKDIKDAKDRLADALCIMGTKESLTEAVQIYHTNSRDSYPSDEMFGGRFKVPKTLFRLGRWDECYKYVKFWTRFAGLKQERVQWGEIKNSLDGTHIWEDADKEEETMSPIVPRGGGTTMNCLFVVLLLKLGLWLNIKEMQSAGVVGRQKNLAPETINQIQYDIANPTILNNDTIRRDILANRPLTRHVEKLARDVKQVKQAMLHHGNDIQFAVQYRKRGEWWLDDGGPWAVVPDTFPSIEGLGTGDLELEADFAVENNLLLLEGQLGTVLDWVFAPNRWVKKGGMYGPGRGWLV